MGETERVAKCWWVAATLVNCVGDYIPADKSRISETAMKVHLYAAPDLFVVFHHAQQRVDGVEDAHGSHSLVIAALLIRPCLNHLVERHRLEGGTKKHQVCIWSQQSHLCSAIIFPKVLKRNHFINFDVLFIEWDV